MLIQQSQINLETNKQEAEMESTDRRTSGEDGASSWGMRGGGKERSGGGRGACRVPTRKCIILMSDDKYVQR